MFDHFFKTQLDHDAFFELIELPQGVGDMREVLILLIARCWENEYSFYGFKHKEFAAEISHYLTAKGDETYDGFNEHTLRAFLNRAPLNRILFIKNDFQNDRTGVMLQPQYEMALNLVFGAYRSNAEWQGK